MKRILYVVLAALLAALPAQSQVPPGEGIVINQTPIQGGSADQCLYKTTAGKVGAQACGTGTAADITVGTTTVTGAASGDLLTRGATALGKLTPGAGVNTWLGTPSSANLATAVTDETGSGSLVFGTSPSLTTPTIGGGTWASIPAATTSGMLYYATNAGTQGGLLRANGTRWKPLNGTLRLGSMDALSADIDGTITIIYQYQIPAGLWQVGDRLRISYTLTKSGTADAGRVHVYIGTAGTTADANVVASTGVLGASSRWIAIQNDIRLESTTSARTINTWGGYGSGGTSGTTSAVTISDASANALYVSVAISSAGATNTVAMYDVQLDWLTTAN